MVTSDPRLNVTVKNKAEYHSGQSVAMTRLIKVLGVVLGVTTGGVHAAYPFGALDDLGDLVTLNEKVGLSDVLVLYHGWSRSAGAFDRVVDGQLLTFSVADTAVGLSDDCSAGSALVRKRGRGGSIGKGGSRTAPTR